METLLAQSLDKNLLSRHRNTLRLKFILLVESRGKATVDAIGETILHLEVVAAGGASVGCDTWREQGLLLVIRCETE